MDLETKTKNAQWKRQAIDEHPLYRTLSSQEKEKMASSITDEQAIKLAESIYGQDLVDTEKQIGELQEKLLEIEQSSNAAWTNGDLSGTYTPSERRAVRFKQFLDTYLPSILGSDNTARYEQQIRPTVQQRFKREFLQTSKKYAGICSKKANDLDDLVYTFEETIDTQTAIIEYNDNTIDIANSQAIEISAEFEELKQTKVDYTDHNAAQSARELRDKRSELRKKSRFFDLSKNKACDTIRTSYRHLINTQKRLNAARAMSIPLRSLASKFQDITDNLQYYSGEEPTMINAGELSDIMNTYQQALKIVVRHDEILDASTQSLVESAPDSLGAQYDMAKPASSHRDFAKEQGKHEREARNIAKIVREMEF